MHSYFAVLGRPQCRRSQGRNIGALRHDLGGGGHLHPAQTTHVRCNDSGGMTQLNGLSEVAYLQSWASVRQVVKNAL